MIALCEAVHQKKLTEKREKHREYQRTYRQRNPLTLIKSDEARRKRRGSVKRKYIEKTLLSVRASNLIWNWLWGKGLTPSLDTLPARYLSQDEFYALIHGLIRPYVASGEFSPKNMHGLGPKCWDEILNWLK